MSWTRVSWKKESKFWVFKGGYDWSLNSKQKIQNRPCLQIKNIPLMHSCLNWKLLIHFVQNPGKRIPLFTSSASVEKKNKTHNNKRNSQTHTVGWLISNKETLCHISQQKKQCSSVLYKQENKTNCSNSAVQAKSRRTHISPDLYKSRRRIKRAVQICHCFADEGRQQ